MQQVRDSDPGGPACSVWWFAKRECAHVAQVLQGQVPEQVGDARREVFRDGDRVQALNGVDAWDSRGQHARKAGLG